MFVLEIPWQSILSNLVTVHLVADAFSHSDFYGLRYSLSTKFSLGSVRARHLHVSVTDFANAHRHEARMLETEVNLMFSMSG